MSIYSGFYVADYASFTPDGLMRKAEYIFYSGLESFGQSVNGTAVDTVTINYSATATGFETYGVYFELLNTIIPLSLVVSIELIKLVQQPFFAYD